MEPPQILNSHRASPKTCNDCKRKVLYAVIDNEDMITFSDGSNSYSYKKGQLKEEQYSKYTGIYMLYNEYTPSTIRSILDILNKKGASVFFYYDNYDVFSAFLHMKKEEAIFLEEDSFLLFFSEKEIASYFTQSDCKYPRIYLNVPTSIKNLITNKKNETVLQLRKQVKAYYEKQDLCKVRENLKVLICSDLFNMGTAGCMAKDYEASLRAAGIEYSLTVEEYGHFHYYEEIYFLRKVLEYKPSVVLGMNVSYASFPYYIPYNLPIISHIDSGNYATDESCYYYMGENTTFLVPFLTLENVLARNFIESEIYCRKSVKIPFVADSGIYREYILTAEEKQKYSSDVCFVGNSTTTKEVLYGDYVNAFERFFMNGQAKKKEWQDFMKDIFEECFELICVQESILSHEFFSAYMGGKRHKIRKFWGEIEDHTFRKFVFMMENYLISPIYRICVMNWIIESKFNVKIFGQRWIGSERYHSLFQGEKIDAELSKAYGASKIVIHSNIVHGIHRRFFEATLSGALCLCPRPEKGINLSGLDFYFKEGEEVVYFENRRDLCRKIEYYLEHEQERKRIVRNCQRVIYKEKLDIKEILYTAVFKALSNIEKGK